MNDPRTNQQLVDDIEEEPSHPMTADEFNKKLYAELARRHEVHLSTFVVKHDELIEE